MMGLSPKKTFTYSSYITCCCATYGNLL